MAIDQSYRIGGGRVGFLLIHGFGGTPVEMRYVAQGLARAGHTVHCPQLAGHCGSEADIKATGWTDWYESVDQELDALRERCDVVIAGGLSAGGLLALRLAAHRPEDVRGMVLFAPTLALNGWAVPWYARLFRLVRQRWFADLIPFEERYPFGIKDERVRLITREALESGESVGAGLFRTPGGVILEMRWLLQDLRPKLKSIRQPTLIVHPREDDRSHLDNAIYLQRRLGGLVETLVLDDSYHIVTLDRQRALVVERTVAFTNWLAERHAEREEVVRIIKSMRAE
jgi:carboxylesterase